MYNVFRKTSSWIVAAFLLVATCLSGTISHAQSSSPVVGSRDLPYVPPAPTFAKPEANRAAKHVCSNTDFWIVSTRRCPQKSQPGCVRCRFDHYHFMGDQCLPQQDSKAFHRWLKPGVPTCVIVHGSFVSFDGLMEETRDMARWLRSARPGSPLNIVYFTWPSDGPFTGIFQYDILSLGRQSAFNGLYLARLISTLPKNSPISLIGHSHGARMVSSALHLLGGGAMQRYRLCKPGDCSRRIRAVFLAAAIDHDWLNPDERYHRALCPTEALLNIRNRSDLALFFYPLRRPFSRTSLARTGFTKRDQKRLGANFAKITELDVTKQIGRHHFWQFYFMEPKISQAIAPYVFFDNGNSSQPGNHHLELPRYTRRTKERKTKQMVQWHRTRAPVRISGRNAGRYR